MPRGLGVGLMALVLWVSPALGQSTTERRLDLAADPNWDGHRNRLVPSPAPRTRQDFGHRTTRLAGGVAAGEVGGRVQRSTTPAWYALRLPATTLDRPHRASGRFAVTADDGSSGVMIGWFHHTSRGWRTPNSLVFRLDGNGGKCWVLFEYGTKRWSTGGGATFEGRYQTTRSRPLLADGASHTWSLAYDPRGPNDDGRITFTLDGRDHDARVPLSHKREGAEFDRFGLLNQLLTGGGLEVYVDDLIVDGQPIDLSRDPMWDGVGNHVTFEDRVLRPFHAFGYEPGRPALGQPARLGGLIWRDEAPAFYADRVGSLSLDDELSASGQVVFASAGSDSGVDLGWFNAAEKRAKNTPEHREAQHAILGLRIEGPSRVGHFVRPVYRTSDGAGRLAESGPILRPDGTTHRWSIHYDPRASDHGRITVALDDDKRTLDLTAAHRSRGAEFDRFGLGNIQSGGHHVEVYLDDLRYTSARRAP